MKGSTASRTDIVVLLAILTLSAITMLWLVWRFPVITALITFAVLVLLGMLARLTAAVDVESPETEHGKQGSLF